MTTPNRITVEDASIQLDTYRAEFTIKAYMALLRATFSVLAIVAGIVLLTTGTAPCDLKSISPPLIIIGSFGLYMSVWSFAVCWNGIRLTKKAQAELTETP